jgi:molecular chaperone DnaJ
MEAVKGIEKQIEITKHDTCWTCEGSGLRPGYKASTCKTCNGRGQVIRSQGPFRISTACPGCRGAGEVITDPCNDCEGSGLVAKKKKVSLRIPAGVDNGARMRLRGEGEGGRRGGPAGDLYVVIYVEAHEFFERHDDDIIARIPLSIAQAALGHKIEVPTIHGKSYLSIPKGTQSGEVYTLKGEGVPRLRGQGKGDMHIEIKVTTPTELTERQKELLKEFEKIESGKKQKQGDGFFKKIFNATG